MNISQLELGWFVGIIDGEGTISIRKQGKTYTPTIKMSNTSKKLIDKFCDLLDKMEVSYHCYGGQREGNRKYKWEVSVTGRPRVLKLLSLIVDSLVSKQRQAEKVMLWIESRGLDLRGKYTENQMKIISDIRFLNGRGKAFSEQVG